MRININEAAEVIGGKVFGDGSKSFENVSDIEKASENDLTFLYSTQFEKFLSTTKACAVIISPELPKVRTDLVYIEVPKPKEAFLRILNTYFLPKFELSGIDSSAFIHNTAELGENVSVGKNVVISEGCKIGKNTKIFHNTVLMPNVTIGEDSLLFPNITIRENCVLKNRVILHSGVVIGADGFGYAPDKNGDFIKIPQIGNVILEDDVELGANTTIDRAALGSTVIGKGTKIDNLVQIAHNVSIGRSTSISAQTGVSGSTKIGSNCYIGGQVGFADHIEIGDKVLIAAQSGLAKSIKTPGTYFGSPAKEISKSFRLEAHFRNLPLYADKIKELETKLKELENKIKTLEG